MRARAQVQREGAVSQWEALSGEREARGSSQSVSSHPCPPWVASLERSAPSARLQLTRQALCRLGFCLVASAPGSGTTTLSLSLQPRGQGASCWCHHPCGSQQSQPPAPCNPSPVLNRLGFKYLEWLPFCWWDSGTLLNTYELKPGINPITIWPLCN